MLLFPPKPPGPTKEQIQQHLRTAFTSELQRIYRHEILALYEPPSEIFTPDGLKLFKSIQTSYSKFFIPYLISGATLIQPDVYWNPFFDLYLLVEDKEGLINSILVVSSLTGGQPPQRDIEASYWQQMYRRYEVAKLTTFTKPNRYTDMAYPILQLRNLTHQWGWPSRIPLTSARIPFDLYIQQPDQAIYCNPIEPGTYVIFNVNSNKLQTNVMSLPPYAVYQTQNQLQKQIDLNNIQGRQILQDQTSTNSIQRLSIAQ